MKILLSENKLMSLITEIMTEYNIYDGNADNNPYSKSVEKDINSLENLIKNDGIIMVNIENGKEYIVYELYSLANIIGKRYCLCQLVKDYKPYGAIYTKPLKLFKVKNY